MGGKLLRVELLCFMESSSFFFGNFTKVHGLYEEAGSSLKLSLWVSEAACASASAGAGAGTGAGAGARHTWVYEAMCASALSHYCFLVMLVGMLHGREASQSLIVRFYEE